MSLATPPAHTATQALTIALIGNPNTGKSTLFNALAGMKARVGNYPGVTVEKKLGRFRHGRQEVTLVDLPGTYSLSPRTPDEMVSVDVLLGRQPDVPKLDAVVCIVDASNLERNLYLFGQVRELGLPTVLVLNMTDVAAARGVSIDAPLLSARLGVPVVVHPAELGVPERVRRLFLQIIVGNPADTMFAAGALLLGGVLQRFGGLRVLLVHGGGFLPYQVGRLELGYSRAPEAARPRSSASPAELLDRVYCDTIVHDARALGHLVDVLGGEQVVLGSDYPYPLGERPAGNVIRTADFLTDEQRAKLLSGNALRYLGRT